MFVLIFLILSLMLLLAYRKAWWEDLSRLRGELKAKEKEFADLSQGKEIIDNRIRDLNKRLDSLLVVYDISRELSKALDARKIIEIFQAKLVKALNLKDCFLASANLFERRKAVYQFYPVRIENAPLRYLAVRAPFKIDDTLLALMANQLALGLRRAGLYQEIQKLAITDGLTEVYTRRYFLEKAAQEFARAKFRNLPASFLMLDIDYFKSYNDSFGHITGDALLKEVAKIITLKLRLIDVCSRWGGEEFCILLPETGKEGAYLAAERLRRAIENEEFNTYDERLKLTVSIGAAVYPEDGGGLELLIDKADKALYKAKKSGRNRVFVCGMKD